MTFVPSVALLKICSFGRVERKQANEWQTGTSPLQGHRPRRRHHVLLGDAALEEAVGQLGAELDEARVQAQVGVERDDARVALRAARGAHGRRRARSAARARRPSAGALGGACYVLEPDAARPSRAEPLVEPRAHLRDRPLVHVGRRRTGVEGVEPLVAGRQVAGLHERHARALDRVGDQHARLVRPARRRAGRARPQSAATSLPSQRSTAQPNARELAPPGHPGR